jgi:hypothetical protein
MAVPIVEVKGQPKALGLRPSPKAALDALPPFGEAVPVIPRSQWPTQPPYWAKALEKALWVRDQGQVGECAACSIETAGERVFLGSGQAPPKFSSRSIYALVNGGRDQGSIPTDNLEVSRTTGFPLREDNPNDAYFKSRLPKNALSNAHRFRSEQVMVIDGTDGEKLDQIMTALLMGFGVSFGMDLPRSFASVGKSRKVPHGHGGGLHAMVLLYGWLEGDTPNFCNRNSWSSAFGDGGHCTLDPDHFFGAYHEFVVIKSVLSDPQGPHLPPTPKG